MRSDGNGTRPPREIQAEIERTRRQMDGTLSAIEHRLTPGQLVDQGMSYLRESGGRELFANLGRQAKENPMPLALVGVGLAWLMGGGPPSSSSSGTEPELRAAKAKLGEVRDSTRQQIDRATQGLDAMVHDRPLALGAIGLAIGALAAALAPRTPQEERVAGKIDEMASRPVPDKPKEEPTQQGVEPYAERAQSEPPR